MMFTGKTPEDDDDDEGSVDPADALFERALFLRTLREADEAERRAQFANNDTDADDGVRVLPNGQRILDYDVFLLNQRYYDDCKHIDCHYIDFGVSRFEESDSLLSQHTGSQPLVVEQDKSLGKGGLCWDAAFILGEYMRNVVIRESDVSTPPIRRLIELGSGTGLCGCMVAQALQQTYDRYHLPYHPYHHTTQLVLTDLPELIPLLQRNVSRNFATTTTTTSTISAMTTTEAITTTSAAGGVIDNTEMREKYIASRNDRYSIHPNKEDISCHQRCLQISVLPLDWSNTKQQSALFEPRSAGDDDTAASNTAHTHHCHDHHPMDIVFGADVVASLYDPILLAQTIAHLSSSHTVVYISFKERLSSIHRLFEGELARWFATTEILPLISHCSRNRNPDVHILRAHGKRDEAEVLPRDE